MKKWQLSQTAQEVIWFLLELLSASMLLYLIGLIIPL